MSVLTPTVSGSPLPTVLGMECLYTDRRHIMVVSKPAGIPMDGGQNPDDHPVTAEMAAAALAAAVGVDEACVSPPRHCHQLDLSTSGLLVYALSQHASSSVADSFARRRVTKHYLAIVHGHVHGKGRLWDWPIDKVGGVDHFTQMIGFGHRVGRQCVTFATVLQRGYLRRGGDGADARELIPVTRMLLIPKSGRRHQLRVHCHRAGHPIVGDTVYSPVRCISYIR